MRSIARDLFSATPGRALAGAVLLAAVLAGCGAAGAAATPSPTASVAPPPSPVATPAATPAPPEPSPTPSPAGPIVHGPVTVVRGTEVCDSVDVNPSPDASGTVHVRQAQLNCTMTFDDPRVSGTKTGDYEFDGWGSLEDGAMVQWGGNRRIENAGGAWVGWFSGVYTSDDGDVLQAWYQGSGGYAGLAFEEFIVEHTGGTYRVTGMIYPGTIPQPWASPAGS